MDYYVRKSVCGFVFIWYSDKLKPVELGQLELAGKIF